MTNREICERLLNIHNRLFHEYALADGMEDIDIEAIGKDLGALILDLSAPEEEPKRETPEAEEKHPGVLAKEGKDGMIEWCWCQKCYAHADVVHDPFGDGEDWSYCKKCGVSFRLKRGE
jgi:hypothetical protein